MAANRNMFAMLADELDDPPTADDSPASDVNLPADSSSPAPKQHAKATIQVADSDTFVATPSTNAHGFDDDVAESSQDALSPEEREARAAATRHKQMAAWLMTYHERMHGPEKPLEKGIWGAVIHPRTKVERPDPENPVEDGAPIRCKITPVPGSTESYEYPNNAWLVPAIPARLGFPVKIASWPYPEGKREDHNQYNYFAHLLMIGGESSQTSFAKYLIESYIGDVLIVRTDAKDLCDQQVDALLHYMNDEFSFAAVPLMHMEEGKEKHKFKKQLADKYLCPEAFHAFFEEFRRERMADGRFWEDAKSPVLATLDKVKPVCGVCYSKKPQGQKFLMCAGCEKRFYCSKDCMDEDIAHHTLICLQDEETDEEEDGESDGEKSEGTGSNFSTEFDRSSE